MSNDNLPPGCKLSDLPGWNDIEVDIDFECDDCDVTWTEHDVTVDSGSECKVESVCPMCNVTHVTTWEPDNDDGDYDDRDYWDSRDEGQDHPFY